MEIGWRVEAQALAPEWIERGGPPVRPPERFGFGSRLIERSVSHGLGGKARIEYLPRGARARLSLPLR